MNALEQIVLQPEKSVKSSDTEICAKAIVADAFQSSIPCGPNGKTCDLDAPCPNHGGSSENETDQERIARERFEAGISAIAKGHRPNLYAPIGRLLNDDEFDNVWCNVRREAKRDARIYDAELAPSHTLDELATVSIELAVINECGEAFDIAHSQWRSLFLSYVDALITEVGR